MPETPERDLEKQLRQHAEQRRAAAGEPSLHPATRRVLQAEVRQHWGNRNSGRAEGGWRARYWPRFALALGLMVVLATATVFMLGPGDQQPASFARLESIETGTAFSAPAPANASALASDAMLVSEDSGPGRVAERITRGATPFADGHANVATMPAAPGAPSEFSAATTLAAKTMAPATEEQFFASSTLFKQASSGVMMGAMGGAAMDVAAPRSTSFEPADKQESAMTQAFRNLAIPVGEKPKGAEVLPVLANFTVAQNGNELTVVDEDGSVYNGTAELAPPEMIVAGRAGLMEMDRAESRPAARLAGKDVESRRDRPAAIATTDSNRALGLQVSQSVADGEVQNWQFKVEGTNRSLRERVVFQGNLIQNSFNTPAGTERQVYQQQPAAQNQIYNLNQGRLSPQNNFINGRVVVGNRKESELNALSVDPK